eukprot:760001_1
MLPTENQVATEWIIVAIVIGVIITVFLLILIIDKLINIFNNREYESIANPQTSSKSVFDSTNNNGNVKTHSLEIDSNNDNNFLLTKEKSDSNDELQTLYYISDTDDDETDDDCNQWNEYQADYQTILKIDQKVQNSKFRGTLSPLP